MTAVSREDEWLFGWDEMPGIVSMWADRDGRAIVWRRIEGAVRHEQLRFRPWLYARHLDDLEHLGAGLRCAEEAPDAPISYRALDGVPGSYRFLLSARSGRALERALLDGAARRLGTRPASLYDLEPDYYRVGPVEQYLMASGRVYYRGLAYSDLHRLQFDLETTALDAEQGRIFMVALRDNRSFARVLEAPQPEDEAQLINELCALIRARDPDIIENHNLFGFDMPFLIGRAEALGLPLDLARTPGPPRIERYNDVPYGEASERRRRVRFSVPGRELIDTLDAVRRHDFVARDLPSHGLKDVARAFGIAASDRTYLAGEQVYATYREQPELVRRYALDDVAEVAALSERLMSAAFALAGMAPRRYERIASAGPAMGILEPMLVRAYLRAGAALPDPEQEPVDGYHTGGALHLFATGIAEHVVKADIASLYPSLMRVYRIGPRCDTVGVLLGLVNRLTDLRLHHKAAARAAPAGTVEAGHHHALQAAMKLIINSAYGYLGAGQMALFADRHAADEVTSRGRAVLGDVVAALRSRNVALIEADTDGVYFATTPHWGEAEQRALVAEVASELPHGIRLEYEGRYAAMLSHEVKNYALLRYDGTLIVRGVALKSSRAEPFGERFLNEILPCALRGDIAAVRRIFVETVLALRARQLPTADVAIRARLSKTPANYRVAGQREGQYEALLNAGRTHWERGERVRYYRRSDNSYALLPELVQDAEPARDYHAEHYVGVLVNSYASRLKKAFTPADFDQLFRSDMQLGLFDQPLEAIQPIRIRAPH